MLFILISERMNIKFVIISIVLMLWGLYSIYKYKFKKYKTDDMLFATSFNLFLGGAISFFIGFIVFIDQLFEIFPRNN